MFSEHYTAPDEGHVYETHEAFYEAVHDDMIVLRDGSNALWLGFETENGDWLCVRQTHEDDPVIDGDKWRPLGPLDVESLPLPWAVWQPGYRGQVTA